ncbi:unnamed protein product, partial [Laminaria digitata]
RLVNVSNESSSPSHLRSAQLFRECAGILEGMKQPAEAAAMYELGGQDHKAAAIYVAGKDLDKAATVMPRVSQSKLLGQYAKACEITGRYLCTSKDFFC